MMFILNIKLFCRYIDKEITEPGNIGHSDIQLFLIKDKFTWSGRYKAKSMNLKNTCNSDLVILGSNTRSYIVGSVTKPRN